jgi:uncharacterized membrane protein
VAEEREQNEPTPSSPMAKSETERDPPISPHVDLANTGLEKILRNAGVDPDDPQVARTLEVVSINATLARGSLPLPPPALMREYADVMPGLPEKLIEWTETQAAHRRDLENQRVWSAEARMNRGQIGALIVSCFGIAVAGIVGVWGSPWVGATIAIVAVGGPTAAVLIARGSSLTGSNGAAKSSGPRSSKSRRA